MGTRALPNVLHLFEKRHSLLPITNYQLPITNYPLPITHYLIFMTKDISLFMPSPQPKLLVLQLSNPCHECRNIDR
ncbi:MAG: hypothetical protein EAZ09_17155 [Oscillatoriales cyanobacterium]|nr:MAG: hypothetical protein EAZ18_08805 [Oscillatoriales cyanobacterium]TAH19035.1 MAG: hypothetical protein EAZ09_17155 [Oscillatoriales cyanobacterium]